jgi:alpha-ribazole phosphatase
MRVLLVRHPQLQIAPGVCYGRRLDIPLTAEGMETAIRMAADPIFAGMARIWSSPARRCREVADRVAATNAVPLTVDPRLHELDFGDWEGMTWEEITRAELDAWAAAPKTFRPPGGESAVELLDRVGSFHADIVEAGQDCAVVSHGGPLRILGALLRGQRVDFAGASQHPMGTIVEIDAG